MRKLLKKRRKELNLLIKDNFRYARFKFIELFSRCANFVEIKHDLIDTEFLYK